MFDRSRENTASAFERGNQPFRSAAWNAERRLSALASGSARFAQNDDGEDNRYIQRVPDDEENRYIRRPAEKTPAVQPKPVQESRQPEPDGGNRHISRPADDEENRYRRPEPAEEQAFAEPEAAGDLSAAEPQPFEEPAAELKPVEESLAEPGAAEEPSAMQPGPAEKPAAVRPVSAAPFIQPKPAGGRLVAQPLPFEKPRVYRRVSIDENFVLEGPFAGPYSSFAELGAGMKTAREANGLTLEDTSGTLRLKLEVLELLEDGAIDRFPHAVYAKGHLRTYASFLHIPAHWYSDLLAARFRPGPMPQTAVYGPDKTARPPHRSKLAGIIASLLVAVGIFCVIWRFDVIGMLFPNEQETPSVSVVPMQTFETEPLEQQPAGQAKAEPAEPAVLPDGMQAPALNPNLPSGAGNAASVGSPSQTLAPGLPETDREPLPALVSPSSPWATLQGNATLAGQAGLATPEPAPQAQSNPNLPGLVSMLSQAGTHNITVVAEQMCWVQVTPDKGRPVQQTLQPGESISAGFETSLILRIGNAGGVRVFYDGVEQGDQGRPGQVRTLTFPPKTAGQ